VRQKVLQVVLSPVQCDRPRCELGVKKRRRALSDRRSREHLWKRWWRIVGCSYQCYSERYRRRQTDHRQRLVGYSEGTNDFPTQNWRLCGLPNSYKFLLNRIVIRGRCRKKEGQHSGCSQQSERVTAIPAWPGAIR